MAPQRGVSHKPGEVCKLKKALYGLQQTPCAWFEKFSMIITSLGFRPSQRDSILFLKCTTIDCIILFLYVDNMIITGDDVNGIAKLKPKLTSQF